MKLFLKESENVKKSMYVQVGLPICREGVEPRSRTVTVKTREGLIEWKDDTIEACVALCTWEMLEIPETKKAILGLMQTLGEAPVDALEVLNDLESRRAIVYFDKENPEQTVAVLKELQLVPQGYLPIFSKPDAYHLCLARRDIRVSETTYWLWIKLQQGQSIEEIMKQLNLTALSLIERLFELIDDQLLVLI